MEKLTDWYGLWAELSDIQNQAFARKKEFQDDDFWKHKAKDFDKMVDKRWSKPDSSRDFFIRTLKDNPGSTLVDIGAGTGKWSILASPYALKITAFEPSSAMQQILKEKIKKENISNIDIVTGTWPEDEINTHDYVLASHSMYGKGDFKAFINKMIMVADKACILILRVPFMDSIISLAAREIFGQPYDSPDFQIAYNALLGMDIYPDVIMEDQGNWPAFENDSFEDALAELKNRFNLVDNSKYDDFLIDLLEENLILKNDKYVWPEGNRSALVYWEV
jgi:SAM-dependent methyltransferase